MNTQLLSIVDRYDSPLYVYDSEVIKNNYEGFINAFSTKEFKTYYACKALSNLTILKLLKSLGAGLDCVSIQEVHLGIKAGFDPEEILYTPNGVSEKEFDNAIVAGVKINVDNLHILEYIGHKHPHIPVCIRINPHIMAGGNRKIAVGHIDSKFGISIHQMPHIKRLVESFDLKVEGIHMHTGSDILDTDIFIKAADLIFSVVEQFDTVEYIDFGSGFKVPYKENDLSTNIEKFGKEFSEVFNTFCDKTGRNYTLCFEPGKFLVSNAGVFLTKVNIVKQTTACVFVGVDSGFNHLIRPMFYDAYHHIENISNPTGDLKIYDVVGYICESDSFAVNRRLNEVRKGDILKFNNAGAYCYAMSSNYNSRYRPAEVLIHENEVHLIREREKFEDLVKNVVEPEIAFENQKIEAS